MVSAEKVQDVPQLSSCRRGKGKGKRSTVVNKDFWSNANDGRAAGKKGDMLGCEEYSSRFAGTLCGVNQTSIGP